MNSEFRIINVINPAKILHSTSLILNSKKGFTVPELIIIMGLVAILSVFAVINLVRPQSSISTESATNLLISDIKQQQLKAMIGDTQGQANAQNFGIYFETNRYVLFRGAAYNQLDPENQIIELDPSITLNNISAPEMVFERRSGEIGADFSLRVNSSTSTEQRTINVNSLGAVNVN